MIQMVSFKLLRWLIEKDLYIDRHLTLTNENINRAIYAFGTVLLPK